MNFDVSAYPGNFAPPRDTQKKFFTTLEGLRGVAAILVMIRHISDYVGPFEFQSSFLAVDLFFVLSGAVIANSYEYKLLSDKMSFKQFFVLRIIRIYPMYLIGSIIGLVAMSISDGWSAKLPIVAALAVMMVPVPILGFSLFPLNFPAWSLLLEFFANFFYAKFVKRLSGAAISAIILISFVLLFVGAVTSGEALNIGWNKITFVFGFPRVMFSFFVGVLIYRISTAKRYIKNDLGPLSAICLLIGAMAVLLAPVSYSYRPYYDMFAVTLAFPIIVFLAMFVSVSGAMDRMMRFLGEISFPLYVLHWPLYMLSRVLVGPMLEPYAPYSALLFAVCVIPASYAAHLRIDVPLRSALKRRMSSGQGKIVLAS